MEKEPKQILEGEINDVNSLWGNLEVMIREVKVDIQKQGHTKKACGL